MEKYKPAYLGKAIIPADDTNKLTDFVQNKYDAFSKIYDSCKDLSDKIIDIKTVETPEEDVSTLSIKLVTDKSVIDDISEKIKDNELIKITGDCITAM